MRLLIAGWNRNATLAEVGVQWVGCTGGFLLALIMPRRPEVHYSGRAWCLTYHEAMITRA